MWKRRAYCKRLQREADDEEIKDSGGTRWGRRQERRVGFWQRSQVGMVQEISHVNFQNKYIIPNCRSSRQDAIASDWRGN